MLLSARFGEDDVRVLVLPLVLLRLLVDVLWCGGSSSRFSSLCRRRSLHDRGRSGEGVAPGSLQQLLHYVRHRRAATGVGRRLGRRPAVGVASAGRIDQLPPPRLCLGDFATLTATVQRHCYMTSRWLVRSPDPASTAVVNLIGRRGRRL